MQRLISTLLCLFRKVMMEKKRNAEHQARHYKMACSLSLSEPEMIGIIFLEQKRAEKDKTAKDTWRVSPSRVGATPAGETTGREHVNSSTTVTLSTPSRKYLIRGRPKGGNVDKREKRKEKIYLSTNI